MTSTNVRFFVNSQDMIVDQLNHANSGLARPCSDGYKSIEEEADLRERLLHHHLEPICRNFLFPQKPDPEDIFAIVCLIRASHLNTFSPHLSVERPFTGELDWLPFSAVEPVPLQPCSTVGFFIDDVERLLLDLYGKVAPEVLVLSAVRTVALMNLKHVRPDLWSEDENAKEIDLFMGIGIDEDLQPFFSNRRRAICAFWDLKRHLCLARDDHENFGPYTHRFIQWVDAHWPQLSSSDFSADLLRS